MADYEQFPHAGRHVFGIQNLPSKKFKLFECMIAFKDRHSDADKYKSDEIFASVLSMLVLYKPE